MLISHDGDITGIGTVLVRQLDAYAMVVPNLIDGRSLTANDVGVILGLHTEGHGEATQLLHMEIKGDSVQIIAELKITMK